MSRYYTDDFKKKIAELRESGRTISSLVKEYGLAKSSIGSWHSQYLNSGSFKASDNITPEEKELKALRKENQRLKMENDILKQAALIMGRREKQ